MTPETFLAHISRRIECAEVHSDPFFHLCLRDIFPQDFYSCLHPHIPSHVHFRELRHPQAILQDGSSSRLEVVFSRGKLAELPPDQNRVWGTVYDALVSREFKKVLFNAHQPALAKRFGTKLSTLEFTPRIALVKDLAGYRIGVHCDILSKAITTQFYLPIDDKHEHIGTSFYSRSESGKYRFVKRQPFRPNFGYSFTVTDDSFHGVDPLLPEDSPRISLMIIYYLQKMK